MFSNKSTKMARNSSNLSFRYEKLVYRQKSVYDQDLFITVTSRNTPELLWKDIYLLDHVCMVFIIVLIQTNKTSFLDP